VSLALERIGSIERELEASELELQKLELQQGTIQAIELEMHSIEKSYQEYQRRYEDERLTDLANPEVVNIRIIDSATAPTQPIHSRIFYIAISVAGGFLLTLAIAFIREYFDHRIYDPDIVAEILGIPTLGSVERI